MTDRPTTHGLGAWLKLAAPLAILALAGLVWIEPWLPGAEWIGKNLGETAILRFSLGFGFLYLALVLLEQRRLGSLFRQVLMELKRFHAMRSDDGSEARREAITILVAALESPDAEVRENAHKHLSRLTGVDHGTDAANWRVWLDAQSRSQRGT
ncbi:MAG: hypothetical protein HZB39_05310 [Planctomycetes bacterium]|nr:hypothetical protein [Planctomycetota bacterium]